MDTDNDGFINAEELHQGLQEAGLDGLSRSHVDSMFEVCDRDQDGRMTQEDWRELILGENLIVG